MSEIIQEFSGTKIYQDNTTFRRHDLFASKKVESWSIGQSQIHNEG